MMRYRRTWTQDEVDYLEENWGNLTVDRIANNLDRTYSSVEQKAYKIGLGDPLTHLNGITISQLSQVLNVHYNIVKNWIYKYDMPAKQRRLTKEKQVWYIRYEDFWKWAEKNRQMLDFARVDRLSLGPEPDWVDVKRKADEIKLIHRPQPHNTDLSKSDIDNFKFLLKDRKSTRLNSSHVSISYAVFCLKKKKKRTYTHNYIMNTH